MRNITLSGFVLILANIVPIIGVLFFSWAPMDVIFIYWLETLFIGFFNIIKMIFAPEKYFFYKFIFIPLFILIFGAFQAFQGVFILKVIPHLIQQFTGEYIEIAILGYVDYLFWSSLALLLSHLFSLIWNFFLLKEYQTADMSILMVQPIPRVFFQQCITVFGCFALLISNSPLVLMILVILAKIYIDLKAHLKSHKSINEVESGST